MKSQFSNDFLEQIKQALLEQRERVQHQLADLTNKDDGSSAFPNYGDGEDENAEEVAAYDTNLQLLDTMQSELRDINDSLQRIEDNSYGVCKYCGNQIDEHRLRARPTSSSCVACKKTLTQEI